MIAKIEEEGGRLEMKRASIVEGLLGAPPGLSSSAGGKKKTDEGVGGNKLARRLSLTGVVVPEAVLEMRKTMEGDRSSGGEVPASDGREGGAQGTAANTGGALMGQTMRQSITSRQSLRKSWTEGRRKLAGAGGKVSYNSNPQLRKKTGFMFSGQVKKAVFPLCLSVLNLGPTPPY